MTQSEAAKPAADAVWSKIVGVPLGNGLPIIQMATMCKPSSDGTRLTSGAALATPS
jgi:hypothetical protein